MAGRNGKNQTVRNMVLSLAVVVPMAGISYLFIPHDSRGMEPARTVDYRVELDTARRAAPYPVLAPEGLPGTWRATSVTYRVDQRDGKVWHLGFLDPDAQYVQLEQSDGPSVAFIDDTTQHAEKTGRTQRVGDALWQRYEGPKYNALVRQERGVTTVVAGTASEERLTQMAAALKPGRKTSG
ncbi:DUF4245 domain-containing protein [Streptomyces sp. NPDC052396]|uniref:DUF4245 domain-containing protein n=1 Tax=Streptomyces sp. NPDC052396 TaxID=3365689 RepID=UPI0037D5209D